MLARSGGSLHKSYWISSQTQQVTEQQEELHSVVCAQMLRAGMVMEHVIEAISVVSCNERESHILSGTATAAA